MAAVRAKVGWGRQHLGERAAALGRVVALAGALAALAVVPAGCGGEGEGGGELPPVSKQELRRMIDQAGSRVDESSGRVEQGAKKKDLEGVKRGSSVSPIVSSDRSTSSREFGPRRTLSSRLSDFSQVRQVANLRQTAGRKDLTLEDVKREERREDGG